MHGRIPLRRLAISIAAVALLAFAAVAYASTVTINARSNVLPMTGKEPLVGSRDSVVVKARNLGPHVPYSIHIYPDTYGQEPTSRSCKGELHSLKRRSTSGGRVVLGPIPASGSGIKPWCKGIVYRGDLHYKSVIERRIAFCVRGSEVGGPACDQNR